MGHSTDCCQCPKSRNCGRNNRFIEVNLHWRCVGVYVWVCQAVATKWLGIFEHRSAYAYLHLEISIIQTNIKATNWNNRKTRKLKKHVFNFIPTHTNNSWNNTQNFLSLKMLQPLWVVVISLLLKAGLPVFYEKIHWLSSFFFIWSNSTVIYTRAVQ